MFNRRLNMLAQISVPPTFAKRSSAPVGAGQAVWSVHLSQTISFQI
jgi:hypothetical protein